MKIRQNRGHLDDSLATTVEIEPHLEAIVAYLRKIYPNLPLSPEKIRVYFYLYDPRCDWQVHVVTLPGHGVLALTDGMPAMSEVFLSQECASDDHTIVDVTATS